MNYRKLLTMWPEMNDELVMGSEIVCNLVRGSLSGRDAVIFATQSASIGSRKSFSPTLCSEDG